MKVRKQERDICKERPFLLMGLFLTQTLIWWSMMGSLFEIGSYSRFDRNSSIISKNSQLGRDLSTLASCCIKKQTSVEIDYRVGEEQKTRQDGEGRQIKFREKGKER